MKSNKQCNDKLWRVVLIELTSSCNFSCSFCPSDSLRRPRATMHRELWRKVLRELGEKQMTSSVFFHLLGEPLLHHDIYDAIEMANGYGISVSLYTNGAILDETRSGHLLGVLKKGRVVLSLQDTDPVSFRARSRGALTWERYQQRLVEFARRAVLRDPPLDVQVHCMTNIATMGIDLGKIMRERRRLQSVYDDWRNRLGEEAIVRLHPFNPGATYPLSSSATFFVKHQGTWDNQHVPEGMEVLPRDRGSCDLMFSTFVVLSDGTCTYCCGDYEGTLNLGNANTHSLAEIYNGTRAVTIREAGRGGRIVDPRCKICRGTLIDAKSRRPVRLRSLLAELNLFRAHLKTYGVASTARKLRENLARRSTRGR